MKTINLSLILLVAAFMNSSYRKECEELILKVESLEKLYGCTDTRNSMAIDLTNDAVIITTQTDFNALVDGPCKPVIDFSKYHLLIGKKTTTHKVDTIFYDYRADCPDRYKTMKVEIVMTTEEIPEDVVYHALISKLTDEEGISLTIISR